MIVGQQNNDYAAYFDEQGTYVNGTPNPAWNDDFVNACSIAGYDMAGPWEYQDTTLSIGEKLPEWDTYVQV